MRLVGSRPKANAGNATDALMDFSWRGGMVMIKRRTSPVRHW